MAARQCIDSWEETNDHRSLHFHKNEGGIRWQPCSAENGTTTRMHIANPFTAPPATPEADGRTVETYFVSLSDDEPGTAERSRWLSETETDIEDEEQHGTLQWTLNPHGRRALDWLSDAAGTAAVITLDNEEETLRELFPSAPRDEATRGTRTQAQAGGRGDQKRADRRAAIRPQAVGPLAAGSASARSNPGQSPIDTVQKREQSMRRRRGPDPHTGTTGTRATATTPAGEDPRLQTLVKRGEAYITFRRERFVLHSRRNQKTHSGLYLNEIYVPPADRGKGIAGEMLQQHPQARGHPPDDAVPGAEGGRRPDGKAAGAVVRTARIQARDQQPLHAHAGVVAEGPPADRHRALAEQADPPGSTSRAGAGFRRQCRRKLRSSRHKANHQSPREHSDRKHRGQYPSPIRSRWTLNVHRGTQQEVVR